MESTIKILLLVIVGIFALSGLLSDIVQLVILYIIRYTGGQLSIGYEQFEEDNEPSDPNSPEHLD